MAEYSRIAKGNFTSTGGAQTVFLPFTPDRIEMRNYSSYATPANHGVPEAFWDKSMGQGYALEKVFNATPVLTTDYVTAGGFATFGLDSPINAGLMLQYGAAIQVASVSKASPAVVTTGSNHGLSTGQVVILQGLYQSATTGMPQICGIPFAITVTGLTTFTIPWNTNQSNYTAISGSPAGAVVRQVLYPYNYLPGQNVISAISLGATTAVTCTTPHNFVAGQQVAFRIPTSYGTTQLNSLPNAKIPGSPIYGIVQTVNSNTQFTVNINSSAYTAFATNQTVAQALGLTPAQVVAVGDINTGGAVFNGGALYPSPSFPTFTGGVSTIGGPAINGAFVNNTGMGFIIGAGAGVNDTASVLVGANGNVIYWVAYLSDFA